MNKSDLINAIAEKTKFTKKDSEISLNGVISSIKDALVKGEKVTLSDFGIFEVKKRGKRKVLNPKTKKQIEIPEANRPTFRAGKGLKELVNKKKK